MPVNLNALIRYKTIDDCLKNPYAPNTIEYLQKKCSQATYEAGTGKGVSERTVRNDIRILRSNVLGFNAPIVINEGRYSYSNINFSLFGQSVGDLELLKEIQQLLTEEFKNIQNEKLPHLLQGLEKLTGVPVPKQFLPTDGIFEFKTPTEQNQRSDYYLRLNSLVNKILKFRKKRKIILTLKKERTPYLSWNYIFEILPEKPNTITEFK